MIPEILPELPLYAERHLVISGLMGGCLGILLENGKRIPFSSGKGYFLKEVHEALGVIDNGDSDSFWGVDRIVATNNGESEPIDAGIYSLNKNAEHVIVDIPEVSTRLLAVTWFGAKMVERWKSEEVLGVPTTEVLQKFYKGVSLLYNHLSFIEPLNDVIYLK